jgi:hypothetical protein
VSLCPLPFSTVGPKSVSTSHCTSCWFGVTMSIDVFYSLSTVCQYVAIYCFLVLCHCVHCLSVRRNVLSVNSVLQCPLLSSKDSPRSVSTSHFTFCLFCVTISTAVFFYNSSLCWFCQYDYHNLESLHCLSVPHTVTLLVLCHYNPWCFYSLSTVCQYVTLYHPLILCHYVHWCILQSV